MSFLESAPKKRYHGKMVLNPNGSSELGEAMMLAVGGLDPLYTSETYIVPET